MAIGQLLFLLRKITFSHKENGGVKPQSLDNLVDELATKSVYTSKSALSKYERNISHAQDHLWGSSNNGDWVYKTLIELFKNRLEKNYNNDEDRFLRALESVVNSKKSKNIFSSKTSNFLLQIIRNGSADDVINLLITHARNIDLGSFASADEYIDSVNKQVDQSTANMSRKSALIDGNSLAIPSFSYLQFIGRRSELNQIDGFLSNISLAIVPKKPVIIYGDEGIGKTALAIHYAREYAKKNHYEVFYLNFHQSLYHTIIDAFAPKMPDTSYEYYMNNRMHGIDWDFLDSVLKNMKQSILPNALLIIDSKDYSPTWGKNLLPKRFVDTLQLYPQVEPEKDDDLLKRLLELPFNLIITTNQTPDKTLAHCLHVEPLSNNHWKEMASNIWKQFRLQSNTLSEEDYNDAISNFVDMVDRNTLLIELFAHTMCYNDKPDIKNWLAELEKVRKEKCQIIDRLFSWSLLRKNDKKFLYLISKSYRISYQSILQICGKFAIFDDSLLKHLVRSGFIYYDYQSSTIYFHPLIQYFLDQYEEQASKYESESDTPGSWTYLRESREDFAIRIKGITRKDLNSIALEQVPGIKLSDNLGSDELDEDLEIIIPGLFEENRFDL